MKTMAISPSDYIKQALTMEQVAEYYGFTPNHAGFIRCPFHGEKTASLKLYPGDRGWHCFGCGAGGSVIDFVMRLFDIAYPQALMRINADFRLGLSGGRVSPSERSKALESIQKEKAVRDDLLKKYGVLAEKHRELWEIKIQQEPSGDEPPSDEYMAALMELPRIEYELDEIENELERVNKGNGRRI